MSENTSLMLLSRADIALCKQIRNGYPTECPERVKIDRQIEGLEGGLVKQRNNAKNSEIKANLN